MKNLVFKNACDALDYIEEFFFDPSPLKWGKNFYGEVKEIQHTDNDIVHVVEVLALDGFLIRKKKRIRVLGMLDPELGHQIFESDFVLWKAINLDQKIPIGVIGRKISLELDLEKGEFLPFKESPKKSDVDFSKAISMGKQLATAEIDFRLGRIFAESEFFETGDKIYISYEDQRGKHVVGWDTSLKTWVPNVSSVELYGFIQTSPKKFTNVVFGESEVLSQIRKRNLVTRLLNGLVSGGIELKPKTSVGVVTILLSSDHWNQILIGEPYLETLDCDVSQSDGSQMYADFTLVCNWSGFDREKDEIHREYGQMYLRLGLGGQPYQEESFREVWSGSLKQIAQVF